MLSETKEQDRMVLDSSCLRTRPVELRDQKTTIIAYRLKILSQTMGSLGEPLTPLTVFVNPLLLWVAQAAAQG